MPYPVVNEANGINVDGSRNIKTIGRKQTNVQTHSNVSIVASGNNINSTWIDTDGFDNVSINILNDANTQFSCSLTWSTDGVNIQGSEQLLSANTGAWANSRSGNTNTKARYLKVILFNNDSGASHVMNAWAYLKA